MLRIWQECIEQWQFCHCWQDLAIHRFTDMLMLLILTAAAVIFSMIATVVDLHSDGLRRLPERTFGPSRNDDLDQLGRPFTAGLR